MGSANGGIITAATTSILIRNYAVLTVTIPLAGAIIGYDAGLKKTWLGPGVMAVCRAFNVMLGMSIAMQAVGESLYTILDGNPAPACGVGLYILGVTWFARGEAGTSHRVNLLIGALLVLSAMAFLAWMPWLDGGAEPKFRLQPTGWLILWLFVAGTILRRMVVAILQPSPKHVQRAVGNAILSIIMIDAAICLGYAEPYWACAVLALMAPAMLLSQFFKVT